MGSDVTPRLQVKCHRLTMTENQGSDVIPRSLIKREILASEFLLKFLGYVAKKSNRNTSINTQLWSKQIS